MSCADRHDENGLGALDRAEPECQYHRLLVSNCTACTVEGALFPGSHPCLPRSNGAGRCSCSSTTHLGSLDGRKPGTQHGDDSPQQRRGAAGEGYAALF